ncbi:hypothetical protein [Petrotoga sp. Shatin.DS.tank11.9.2.9.3]|uniref:hypothetical protein n=1 Tax=Petrotoga sp. Shatin.DS.tank11.9.2.9.3 TaxID=1469556 RepID=UPI000EF193CE|nr:hypothetical protein [Petrotoga sp. Shatin.DS.tank11.9.2.9.3]
MNLEYVKNEVVGNRITIWVKSAKKEVICPYCGKPSKKGHWLWNWNIQRYSFVESIINLVNEFKQMLK